MPATDPNPDTPLLEKIERRAVRIWLRRRIAAGTAVLAAVALVAVPVMTLDGGERRTVEAADPAAGADDEEPTASSLEPVPTTTTSTTTSTAPPRSEPPPEPLTVDGASGQLTASATVDDSRARTGQVLTFALEAHDENAAWIGFEVDFGDGTGRSMAVPDLSCPGDDAEEPTSDGPVDEAEEHEHMYGFPGTYQVVVTAHSGGCSGQGEAVELRFEVEVEGPEPLRRTASDGGLDVELLLSTDEPAVDETVIFRVRATDSEGLMTEFTWAPGDGQPGKERTSSTHCEPREGEVDRFTDFTEHMRHAYARPGTYEAVITFTTSTCDDPPERVEIRAPIDVE